MKKLIIVLLTCVSFVINAQEVKEINLKETDKELSEVIKKKLLVAEKQVVQDFYTWQITNSIINIVLLLSLIMIVIFIWKRFNNFVREKVRDYDKSPYMLIKVIIVFIFLLFINGIVLNIKKLVFIKMAPKLYLIEYFIK